MFRGSGFVELTRHIRTQQSIESAVPKAVEKLLLLIDKGLDRFGPTVKNVAYFKFEKDNELNPKDIPEFPNLFIETIDRMFGAGAPIVKSYIETEIRAACISEDLGHAQTSEILRRAFNCLSSSSR